MGKMSLILMYRTFTLLILSFIPYFIYISTDFFVLYAHKNYCHCNMTDRGNEQQVSVFHNNKNVLESGQMGSDSDSNLPGSIFKNENGASHHGKAQKAPSHSQNPSFIDFVKRPFGLRNIHPQGIRCPPHIAGNEWI